MIGLDTNVLIRYIVRDDDRQAKVATKLIESSCTADDPGFVNLVVLCEISWVLGRGYQYDRQTVAAVIRGLLTSVELEVEASETVWRALRAFEQGKADFADAFIGAHNRAQHVSPTYTFDRKASNLADFVLLGTKS
ncbi:MAG: type II toxin-antitoxin system VapC family toxin [Lentisphaerae bacterium]|nr:type II toxin-antitoxin system VapC family toxin [Lentisphaerota bacterium]